VDWGGRMSPPFCKNVGFVMPLGNWTRHIVVPIILPLGFRRLQWIKAVEGGSDHGAAGAPYSGLLYLFLASSKKRAAKSQFNWRTSWLSNRICKISTSDDVRCTTSQQNNICRHIPVISYLMCTTVVSLVYLFL